MHDLFNKPIAAALAAGLWGISATCALSAPVAPVLARPAVQTGHASKSVLIDIASAGKRLVAVGERGIVITSDDNGKSWRQSMVPVSVTLTAVQFVDAENGWAVGHSGVILNSRDGGATWRVQLDGIRASALLLAEAKQADSSMQPGAQAALRTAQQFVDDGPDKPFLNVHFDDARHGYVTGAYGLIFRTIDGGESWQPWMQHVDNPKGMNLYSVTRQGSMLYLAGEQGYFARSDDEGSSFRQLPTPHGASYFAMQNTPDGRVVIAGLRGSAFVSADQGGSWQSLDIKSPESISTLLVLKDGRILYGDQAGKLSVQRMPNQPIEAIGDVSSHTLTAAVMADNGSLVTTGFRGINIIGKSALASMMQQGEAR